MWRLAVLTESGRILEEFLKNSCARSMLNAFIRRQQNVVRRSPQ